MSRPRGATPFVLRSCAVSLVRVVITRSRTLRARERASGTDTVHDVRRGVL